MKGERIQIQLDAEPEACPEQADDSAILPAPDPPEAMKGERIQIQLQIERPTAECLPADEEPFSIGVASRREPARLPNSVEVNFVLDGNTGGQRIGFRRQADPWIFEERMGYRHLEVLMAFFRNLQAAVGLEPPRDAELVLKVRTLDRDEVDSARALLATMLALARL